MAVHSRNKALLYRIFLSSLGPVAMRWFDDLGEGLINFFQELTRAFGARFVTCSRVPCPLDSLLSMTMREGETLRTYSNRYWEMFNKIDGNFEDVTIRTFNVGLPTKHDPRKSLTRKPALSMQLLMDRIDEYQRDLRSERYNNNRPRKDFAEHVGHTAAQVVSIVFRESVHQILGKIKNEPYFKWPNKMGGDPMKRNQNLYY